jgi:CRP-like cAMP-binding protein
LQELARTIEINFGNRLLDGLPREDLTRLAPLLRRVFLHRGSVLSQEDSLHSIYFPVDALISTLINTTGTDRTSALSVIGRRGAIDVTENYFGPSIAVQTTVLCPGSAWRLGRTLLRVNLNTPLQQTLRRHERALFAVGAARLACNSEHNVDRRVARWLLYVADETGKPQAELTHQQLAQLAAIRRPSVSLVFADLARRGIVNVHHGLVQILDRERLEREACACHHVIRDLLDRAATGA